LGCRNLSDLRLDGSRVLLGEKRDQGHLAVRLRVRNVTAPLLSIIHPIEDADGYAEQTSACGILQIAAGRPKVGRKTAAEDDDLLYVSNWVQVGAGVGQAHYGAAKCRRAVPCGASRSPK
jgi:hypothetical protein